MSCTDVQTIQAGNGTKTQFSFDFPYIFKSEIHVYFWNATTKEWDEKLTTDATHPWRITDANPTIVEFTSTAPPSTPETGVDNVRIRRITNLDDIRALFNPGSAIRSDDLNNNFEQLRYAIQEANCQDVPEEIEEYINTYYWNNYTDTVTSSDTWDSSDTKIATTAALDARFQDEANETITSSESWVSDNDHVATTAAIDARFQDELNETITSSETWPDNDDTIATTAAIDNRIDTAITNDIGTDGTGITVTDDGDGTITLGLGSGAIDLDRIKAEDIITQSEQDADYDLAGDDDSVFTSSAAIRRFENYVQNSAPSGTGIGTGRVWVDVDNDLTLSVWNGSAWSAITSGGTFTEQPNVVYVDGAGGLDTNDGHRVSRPKQTIRAAINQINAEINTSVTNGGSGYVEGTYNTVALTGGTGTGLTADIVVNASGVVTTVTVNSTTTLEDYNIGDVLSADAANLGGSGSGLQITVGGNGDGQIVVVAAGTYQEIAPLQIKRRNVSVIGQALRSCIVHPTSATELNNLFELNSGSYIANLTLTGMQAGTGTGNTLDAVLPTDQGWNFAFYNNAFITKSPYIQNCTNFSDSEIDNDDLRSHRPRGGQAGDTDSAPTGGGLLVNGATPHADSPLRSMVADSYTHVALNGPGILVTNNGYTQITSSYAFFNTYHIKCLNGGQANLAASTTDFGDRSLVADGRSTTNIFTADCVTAVDTSGAAVTTIRVSNGVADASWHGTSTRPSTNMLLSVNSDAQIYPITNVVPQDQTTFDADPAGYTGDWIVTISRPDPTNRSNNLGFSADVATGTNNVQFWLRSMIASSGHTMEYVGSGTDYRALPENGGVPNEARQITESNNGKVWTAITDHNGKFRIGGNQTDDPIFEVDQQLGFVTIPEGSIAFNLLSDATPQLGGNLDVNGNTITSTSNANVVIDPNGTGVVDVSTSRITNVTDPTDAQDAATKNYVDTELAGISSNAISQDNSSVTVTDTGTNGAVDIVTDNTSKLTVDSDIDLKANTVLVGVNLTKTSGSYSVAQITNDGFTLWVKNNTDRSEIRFLGTTVSDYVGFRSPGTFSGQTIWNLPSADGSANQILTTDGSGTLSFADAASPYPAKGASGTNQWAVVHSYTVDADYSIPSGSHVINAGPMTVNSGVTVTIPTGSNWTIV